MWDEVIIGKGEQSSSATRCYEGPDTKVYIAHNNNSYWISDLILGGSMKIFKECREGQYLTRMLSRVEAKAEYEYKIYNYLSRLFLKRVNPSTLMTIITNNMEDSYRKGQEAKAREIRVALNMESNDNIHYLTEEE
jgi:hypothetical protein